MQIFLNRQLTKKNFDNIFNFIFEKYNKIETLKILDSLKLAGLTFSTKAGLSLSISDFRLLKRKKNSKNFLNEISNLKLDEKLNKNYNSESINKVWNNTNETLKTYILNYLSSNDPYNQLIVVLQSGARGSKEQIHQLLGLRSLMVDQSGAIVPFPIKKSFMDGLSIFEYLLSSFGARKGIIDTALKTADSGYLTRRLIEAAYEIKILTKTCKYSRNICYKTDFKSNKLKIYFKNSVLNCFLAPNLCQNCFNLNFSTRKIISLGETVGILCAQSISEPSTQLTMRTFHTGGVFSGKQEKKKKNSKFSGFTIICKKSKSSNLINWKNEEKKIAFFNVQNNTFVGENLIIKKSIKKTKSFLPYYIGFLNKKDFIVKLIQNKNYLLLKKYCKNFILSKYIKIFISNKNNVESYKKSNVILYNNIMFKNKVVLNKKIINICTKK